MRGLNIAVGIGARILPSFNAAASTVERRFAQMSQRGKRYSAEMRAGWQDAERRAGSIGSASRDFATHVSAPAAALSALGGRAAYQWSKVGNELQAVTQMSDDARRKIEAVARAMLGNSTSNLSMGLDLARTGFSAREIQATLGTTMKLSRADNSVDPAGAADIMTNVMQGMRLYDDKMSIDQIQRNAERVANNIAVGAAKSSSDIRLMGESFKYAAPLWARAGMDIEDLTASIMTMANSGIKGSEAGVAIRSGLIRLVKPTKSAIAVMDRLGMKIGDYVTSSRKPTGDAVIQSLRAQGIAADGAREKIGALLNDQNLSGGALIAKISEAIAAGMEGGADAADLDKISDGVADAITAGATKVDLIKFLRDANRKGMALGDIVNFFDVRQGARLSTLLGADLARSQQIVQSAVKVSAGEGTFLDKMYAMQMQGAVGPWERMQQGMSNMFISMAESGAMDAVASGMNAIANGMMAISRTSPGTLKFITLTILGVAALAPLGFALTGVLATFRLLAFPLSIVRLGLGKLLPRIVSTRIAMVAARYGIVSAAWEIMKVFGLMPVRIGAALATTAKRMLALRTLATGASGTAGVGTSSAGGAAASAASGAGGAAGAAASAAGGGIMSRIGLRVAASPVVGSIVRGLSTVGPWLLRASTGWGGLIVRGLLIGLGSIGTALAGITAPVWGVIAAIGAAFIGLGFFIKNNWKGIGAFFSSLWRSFATATAPLRQSLGQLGSSLANLGRAFFGWLGRLGGIAAESFGGFMRAVGSFLAPGIAMMKAQWASLAPIVMPVVNAIGAVIGGLVGIIKMAIGWIANLVAPVAIAKWQAWGSALGSAIGGVVSKLKGFVDWVRSGIDAVTDFFNRSAQPAPPVGAKSLPMPRGAGAPAISGKRARGGPVIGGKLYLVGEHGPEFFRAPSTGSIIPANDTQQIITAADRPMPASSVIDRSRSISLASSRAFRAGDVHNRGTSSSVTNVGARSFAVAAPANDFARAISAPSNIIRFPEMPLPPERSAREDVMRGRLADVVSPAAVEQRRQERSARPVPSGPITIHINGATDPTATAREVERTLRRMAAGQSAYLSD